MSEIRCPNCKQINPLSATGCSQCDFPFGNLPPTAYVSAPGEKPFEAKPSFNPPTIPQDNETGRKAFLWYRVYCGVMVAIYFLVAALGAVLAVYRPTTREYSSDETMIMGIIYAIAGVIFLIVFAVFLFLPRKPYNWIVGIVAIAIGMTSCCLVPFMIPLLIYWIKPETKAFFGRN